MPRSVDVSYVRSGAISAAWSVAVSVAAGLVLAVVAGVSDPLAVLRAAVRGWLVANGSGITVDSTSTGIVPWGGVLALIAVTAVSVRGAVPRDGHPEPAGFVASTAGFVAVLAAFGALATSTGGVEISVVRAAFSAFAVAGVGAAIGLGWRTGSWEHLVPVSSDDALRVTREALRGVLVLWGAAAMLVAALLVVHVDRAVDLWGALAPGAGGSVVLGLICLASLPSLALWSYAVMVGPGFGLGDGTSVTLAGSQVGAMPALPTLAAVPAPGEFAWPVLMLSAVPAIVGGWIGWRLAVSDGGSLSRVIGLGGSGGLLAGFLIGLATSSSGGSLGAGRMAHIGPHGFAVLVLSAVLVGVGGAVGAAAAHYREVRASD